MYIKILYFNVIFFFLISLPLLNHSFDLSSRNAVVLFSCASLAQLAIAILGFLWSIKLAIKTSKKYLFLASLFIIFGYVAAYSIVGINTLSG